MPRNVRMTQRKRPTKWCAQSLTSNVPDNGSLVIGDGLPLCTTTTAVNDEADPVIGWCRGSISLSRVGTGDINPAVAWAIVMMRTEPGGGVPIQVFDPFAVDDLERQDILGMGMIAVQPTVLNAADAHVIQRGASVTEINIRVGRKWRRNTNGLFLWVASQGASDNNYQSTCVVRSLMKF